MRAARDFSPPQKNPPTETYSFECVVCGSTLESWDNGLGIRISLEKLF
jgi:hypothetical protein